MYQVEKERKKKRVGHGGERRLRKVLKVGGGSTRKCQVNVEENRPKALATRTWILLFGHRSANE